MTAALPAAARLAAFAAELAPGDVPDEVLEQAKLHVLDTLGCGLAASGLGLGGEGRTVGSAAGGAPEASVIGSADRLPAAAAAFANAMLCHALDYDDTHAPAISHVSVTAAPAALAVGEAVGASGRDVLLAYVAAAETTARIGTAASGRFHARGIHPTSACGVFGAAVAAARLHGLDTGRTTSALGLAGSMSSGLLAFLDDGTATKPVNAGIAAHGGVLAAELAAAGAEGPASVLDGRFGLYRALLGEDADLATLLDDLGSRWETVESSYKAYPACHIMHGALGAAALLRDRLPQGGLEEIEEIVVVVPPQAVAVILEPAHVKIAPRTDYEGKFSAQFSVAAMLAEGRVGLPTYRAELLADERVLALARRVRYETKAFMTSGAAFPGGVRLRLAGGTELEAELDYQRGAPENPLTPDEVRDKFRENASLALDPARLERLVELIDSLDRVPDVRHAFTDLTHHLEGVPA